MGWPFGLATLLGLRGVDEGDAARVRLESVASCLAEAFQSLSHGKFPEIDSI
jgi:hypothetical protein